MWNKIKSWFRKKPKPNINYYTDLLERSDEIDKRKVFKVVCPICGLHFNDNIELIQHGISAHGKTFEEMKQLIELVQTKGN